MGCEQMALAFGCPSSTLSRPTSSASDGRSNRVVRPPRGQRCAVRLATLNPATQAIEFHPPTALFLNDGEQPTVVVDSPASGVHFEVTTDHDVYAAAADAASPTFVKMRAASLLRPHGSSDPSAAWRFQASAGSGVVTPLVDVEAVWPGMGLQDTRRCRAFFAVLGLWLRNGVLDRRRGRVAFRFAGSDCGKDGARALLEEQLAVLDWRLTDEEEEDECLPETSTVSTDSDEVDEEESNARTRRSTPAIRAGHAVRGPHVGALQRWLAEHYGREEANDSDVEPSAASKADGWISPNQHLPEPVFRCLTADTARALLDGLTRGRERAADARSHSTEVHSAAFAEQLSRVALLAGFSATWCRSKCGWQVDYTDATAYTQPCVSLDSIRLSRTTRTWCVDVPPHHLILVRRRLPPSDPHAASSSPSPSSSSSSLLLTSRPVWLGNCFEYQTVYAYIQSRFYRSPEVLLGLPYNASIDMWSLGCIAAELFLGLPLFPGVTQHNQIDRIIRFLGPPPLSMLERGKAVPKFFSVSRAGGAGLKAAFLLKTAAQFAEETKTAVVVNKVYFKGDDLQEVIDLYPMRKSFTAEQREQEKVDRQCFLHFLTGLLRWEPSTRWTPYQTSHHPFLHKQPLSAFDEVAFEQLRYHDAGATRKAAAASPGPSGRMASPGPIGPPAALPNAAFAAGGAAAAAASRPLGGVLPAQQPQQQFSPAVGVNASAAAASASWAQRGRAQSWTQSGTNPLVTAEQHRQYIAQQQQQQAQQAQQEQQLRYHPATHYRTAEPLAAAAVPLPSASVLSSNSRRQKPGPPLGQSAQSSAWSSPVLSPAHSGAHPSQQLLVQGPPGYSYPTGHESALPGSSVSAAASSSPYTQSPFSPLGSPQQRMASRPRQGSIPSSPARRPTYPAYSTTYSTRPTNVHALGSPSHQAMAMANAGKRHMDEFDLTNDEAAAGYPQHQQQQLQVLQDDGARLPPTDEDGAAAYGGDEASDVLREGGVEVDPTGFAEWDPFFNAPSEHSDASSQYSSTHNSPRHAMMGHPQQPPHMGYAVTSPQRRQPPARPPQGQGYPQQQPQRGYAQEGGGGQPWPLSPVHQSGYPVPPGRQRVSSGGMVGSSASMQASRLPPPLGGRRPSQPLPGMAGYGPPPSHVNVLPLAQQSSMAAASPSQYAAALSRSVPEHPSLMEYRDGPPAAAMAGHSHWAQQAQLNAQQHAAQQQAAAQGQAQPSYMAQTFNVPYSSQSVGRVASYGGSAESPTSSPQPSSSPLDLSSSGSAWYASSPPSSYGLAQPPNAASSAARHANFRRGSLPANAGSSRILPVPNHALTMGAAQLPISIPSASSMHGATHPHFPPYPVGGYGPGPRVTVYDVDEPLALISPGTSVPQPSAPMLIGSPTSSSQRPYYGHPATHASSRNPIHPSALLQYSPAGSYSTPSYMQQVMQQQQQQQQQQAQGPMSGASTPTHGGGYGYPRQPPSPLSLHAAGLPMSNSGAVAGQERASPSQNAFMQQLQQQQQQRRGS